MDFLAILPKNDQGLCHVFGEDMVVTEDINSVLGALSVKPPFNKAKFVQIRAVDAFGMTVADQLPALLFYTGGSMTGSHMRALTAMEMAGAEKLLLSQGF